MGYYDADVYYQPEKFGLTLLDEIDDPQACYSFDILAVWQHEDGRLFWASDSGCSCPSPFEDFTSLDDLTPITQDTWDDFAAAVGGHCRRQDWHFDTEPVGDGWTRDDLSWPGSTTRRRWHRWEPDPDDFAADKVQMLAKVRGLLNG